MDQQNSTQKSIVILGAGVIGLTIAHELSLDPSNKIIIVARDMPEDIDSPSQGWSSPWAGADWSPMGNFDERKYKWESVTVNKFWNMSKTHDKLVMELPARIWDEDLETLGGLWWKDIVRDVRVLPSGELPSGVTWGLAYKTFSTRPATYLPWIKTELVSRGVTFVRKTVGSIEEVAGYGGDESILINASAMGARSLLGVEDLNVYPIRGQTAIVRAPHVKECLSNRSITASGEVTYMIPRPDGTVILGGTFQPDNWDTSVNHKTAQGIFERCAALDPGLSLSRGTEVLSHNVGLRPARRGGPRVEVENMQLPLENDLIPVHHSPRTKRVLKIIHAYGFGPAGYQQSWGVAQEVASLLATHES